MTQYTTALKLFEEVENEYGIASCYNGIGEVYAKQLNYKDALKNYLTALKIGDNWTIATANINIGNIYTKRNITIVHPII